MIRGRNVSSKEIILNRDLDDATLSDKQVSLRLQNHPHSAKCKVKKGVPAKASVIWPGALVFLKKDLSKLKGREEYIVVSLDQENPEYCHIKKAVKQLRVENYRVKLTEITLIPNQEPPEVDNPPLDSSHIDMSPPENDIEKDASFTMEKNG